MADNRMYCYSCHRHFNPEIITEIDCPEEGCLYCPKIEDIAREASLDVNDADGLTAALLRMRCEEHDRRMSAKCPRCAEPMYFSLEAHKAPIIVVAGDVSSGKSSYLSMAWRGLLDLQGLKVRTNTPQAVGRLERVASLIKREEPIPPTDLESPLPIGISLSSPWTSGMFVTYDVAGQVFQVAEDVSEEWDYVTAIERHAPFLSNGHTRGILLLIDPEDLDASGPTRRDGWTAIRDPRFILRLIANAIRHEDVQPYLAIVVGKVDVLSGDGNTKQAEIVERYRQTYQDIADEAKHSALQEYNAFESCVEKCHDVTRDLIEEFQIQSLLREANNSFAEVRCFCQSSFSMAKGEDSFMTLMPLMWLIQKTLRVDR